MKKLFLFLGMFLFFISLTSCTQENTDKLKTSDEQKKTVQSSQGENNNAQEFSYVDLYSDFNDILSADYIEFRAVEYLCFEEGMMFSNFYYFEDLVSGEIIEVMNPKDEYFFLGGHKYILALVENTDVDYYSLASFEDNAVYPIIDNYVVLPERYNTDREQSENYVVNFFEEVGIVYEGSLQTLKNKITLGGACNNPEITDDYPTLNSLVSSEYGSLFYVELISIEKEKSTSELTFLNILRNDRIIVVVVNDSYTFEINQQYIILLTQTPDIGLFILTDIDSIIRIENEIAILPSKYAIGRTKPNDLESILSELGLE